MVSQVDVVSLICIDSLAKRENSEAPKEGLTVRCFIGTQEEIYALIGMITHLLAKIERSVESE